MINCAQDARVALQLARFHSWPVLRVQSNGEHSCQILRILLTVWPECPRRVLVHVVTHDMGEMAGDIQWPYKSHHPDLKAIMDGIERSVVAEMRGTVGAPPVVVLSAYELAVFKTCEWIEVWEYALHEMGLGNRYARIIAQRGILGASDAMGGLEALRGDALDVCPAIKRYVDKRTAWERSDDND